MCTYTLTVVGGASVLTTPSTLFTTMAIEDPQSTAIDAGDRDHDAQNDSLDVQNTYAVPTSMESFDTSSSDLSDSSFVDRVV